MTSDAFRITCERTGTTVRLNVTGELDLASGPRLRDRLSDQLADHAEIVVLDLADVSFIDSTGLHALLDATAQDGNRLRIIPNPGLLRLLDITGLHDRLPIVHAHSHRRHGTGQQPRAVSRRLGETVGESPCAHP
jgi:anti-anti-sigma factor